MVVCWVVGVVGWWGGGVVRWSGGRVVGWSGGRVVGWSGRRVVRWSSRRVVRWSSGPRAADRQPPGRRDLLDRSDAAARVPGGAVARGDAVAGDARMARGRCVDRRG